MGLACPRPRRRITRFCLSGRAPIRDTSESGKPAERSRAAIASDAFVQPLGGVVSICTSSLRRSRANRHSDDLSGAVFLLCEQSLSKQKHHNCQGSKRHVECLAENPSFLLLVLSQRHHRIDFAARRAGSRQAAIATAMMSTGAAA